MGHFFQPQRKSTSRTCNYMLASEKPEPWRNRRNRRLSFLLFTVVFVSFCIALYRIWKTGHGGNVPQTVPGIYMIAIKHTMAFSATIAVWEKKAKRSTWKLIFV